MGATAVLSLLPAEVVLEDFEGGGLVDDVLLILGFFTSETEFLGGVDGGEGFVVVVEREVGEGLLNLFSEVTNLLGGVAFAAIGFEGESEEEGFDFSLGDNFSEANEGLYFVAMNGLDGMGRDPEVVGGGEANAGVAMVDGEDGVLVVGVHGRGLVLIWVGLMASSICPTRVCIRQPSQNKRRMK